MDELSEAIWQEHRVWLEQRKYREREQARWHVSDWRLLWLLSEVRWEQEPFGLYVNAVTRASWDVALHHAARRLR